MGTVTKLKLPNLATKHPKGPIGLTPMRGKQGDAEVQAHIMALPYEEGNFTFIRCSRKKATNHQKWIYGVNKENAAGRRYFTRYDAYEGILMVGRLR